MPRNPQEVDYGPWDGTSGNDVIYDNDLFDAYYGYAGDDVFYASATDALPNGAGMYYYPDDYYYGGSGSDTVSYVLSTNKIDANLSTSLVFRIHDGAVQSTDFVFDMENVTGSNYDDTIVGSSADNLLRGGGGIDTITGLNGNDHVWGDSGNDILDGGNGEDIVDGGTGNDSMIGGSGNDTMNGGDGNDTINGGSDNDRIDGGGGNDTIDGSTGTDTVVYTGPGAVTVDLWSGNASGAWGNDTLSNIERVETGSGDDIVYGSAGSNRIDVGSGNDTVLAFDGHDTVYAGSGNDTVYGYQGNDLIYAGTGNDTLWGGSDGDTVYGEDGNDLLKGEDGNDFLYGGNGADRIRGGNGDDTINGGSGADVVEWLAGDSGWDSIAGFSLGEDHLYFSAGFFAVEPVGAVHLDDVLMAAYSGSDALLIANTAEHGWTFIATLQNVSAALLDQAIANESILGPALLGGIGGGLGDLEMLV